MQNEQIQSELQDDGLPSAEEQYELWDWARAAGVSAEELRKALQQNQK